MGLAFRSKQMAAQFSHKGILARREPYVNQKCGSHFFERAVLSVGRQT